MEWVALIIFGVIIYYIWQYWQYVFGVIIVGVVISYASKSIKEGEAREAAKRRKHEEMLAAEERARNQAIEEKKRNIEKYNADQNAIRQRLYKFVSSSASIFQGLSQDIDAAEHALDEAEIEFAEGAFAPFWDAVERAANKLAFFNLNLQKVISHSENYKSEIKKFDSTPPPLSLDFNTFPDATHTATRMRGIVRLAQKNFHFAAIYEQRKTNQLLVKGFSSLGEALNEMSCRIETSIDALSCSISDLSAGEQESSRELLAGVDSLREQLRSDATAKREHEKEQRKMLDNIQRRRKPS